MLALNEIHHGDCLELMKQIPDASVDMVLCDLPYGTTANKWDTIIPFEPLWNAYKRICKPNAAIVLTANQPFTSILVASALNIYSHNWIWVKNRVTSVLNAKLQPLRNCEDVLVFCLNTPNYYPQGLRPHGKVLTDYGKSENYGAKNHNPYIQEFTNYPRQTLEFDSPIEYDHPTQKPVALFEYLIRTYTKEGMVVLDNCIGSGTTAVAAINSGRQFIGIEQEQKYVDIARRRVADALAQPKLFY